MSTKKTIRRFRILKWIPRILMLGVIGFSAYVYLSYGTQQEQNAKKNSFPTQKRKVVQETNTVAYSHYDKGILAYTVNAKRTIQMKSKAQQLEDPEFIFYDKDQKESMRVRGKRCNISRGFCPITPFLGTGIVFKNHQKF